MIDTAFGNINKLFVLSFKNGEDNPARNIFYEYYTPLVEIKGFNAFIDNKPFFFRPVKTNRRRMKNMSKYQKNQNQKTKKKRLYN